MWTNWRSAKAGYYASKYKRFGNLCYVIGALRAFLGHDNWDLKIKVSNIFLLTNSIFMPNIILLVIQHNHKNTFTSVWLLAIQVDGGEWEVCHKVTALCIGNAKFFGGGMKIAPAADPSNGNLEVICCLHSYFSSSSSSVQF